MTTAKRLGIWMDHSAGHLIEFNSGVMVTQTISSDFTHHDKEQSLQKNEHQMHHKEQQHQTHFYRSLGDVIKKYDEVILFGPTEAKSELFNMLRKDHHFDKINITVKPADKMSEGQQHAFVRDYFSHKLV